MKKVNVSRYTKEDGTVVENHQRTILTKEDTALGTGLFDDLNEQLDAIAKKDKEIKMNLNNIFNRLSVRIVGQEQVKVAFRKYNCLTQPKNPEAESICWKEETTSNLGVSWLIAHSPSASMENEATQVIKFYDENRTAYDYLLKRLLKRLEAPAMAFVYHKKTEDPYIDMRHALDCLDAMDVEEILKLYNNGLEIDLAVLKVCRMAAGVSNDEYLMLRINERINKQ